MKHYVPKLKSLYLEMSNDESYTIDSLRKSFISYLPILSEISTSNDYYKANTAPLIERVEFIESLISASNSAKIKEQKEKFYKQASDILKTDMDKLMSIVENSLNE